MKDEEVLALLTEEESGPAPKLTQKQAKDLLNVRARSIAFERSLADRLMAGWTDAMTGGTGADYNAALRAYKKARALK
jgi:hypothetical protein